MYATLLWTSLRFPKIFKPLVIYGDYCICIISLPDATSYDKNHLRITNNSYSADRMHKWRAHNQRELMISFIKTQGNATITHMHHDEKTQYINSHTTSKGKMLVFISHDSMGLSVIMAFPGHTHSFFTVLQMEGLWYEIARTRFTFNKMESVISYHRYDPDENLIKSYYTGTT